MLTTGEAAHDQELSQEYPVRMLYRVLHMPPSSYYYRSKGGDDLALLRRIKDVLVRFLTYGYRRATAQLRREGYLVNRKRVRRVMRANDLIAMVKHQVHTPDNGYGYQRYPNLVRGLEATRPD